jgi:hypothetical protein
VVAEINETFTDIISAKVRESVLSHHNYNRDETVP